MEYLLRQCTRRLKKYKHYHGLSVSLLKTMQKEMKQPSREHWIALKDEIEETSAQSKTYPPVIIYSWVLFKLQNRPYKEIHEELLDGRITFFKASQNK
ncbi:MAG: hypothetical protein GY810_19565 [Aureispira sp.]|nr:hypothetical protein [Aureispira sp.]